MYIEIIEGQIKNKKILIPTRTYMENKLLLRSIISLVRVRTGIKNKIHTIIDRNRDCYLSLENLTDIFGKTGTSILASTKIAGPDYMILTNYLGLIADINKKIKDIELLKTVPGVGSFTAFILKSEIDSIDRFISKEKFASYAGLTHQFIKSGPKSYTGKITKQGNKFIRWATEQLLCTSKVRIDE